MTDAQANALAKEFEQAVRQLKGEDVEAFRVAMLASFNHLAELSANPALVKLLREAVDGLSYKVKVAHMLEVVDRAALKAGINDFAAALRKFDRDGTRAAADVIFQMPKVN
jgi:DNA-binding FadR family transcriptional regulator